MASRRSIFARGVRGADRPDFKHPAAGGGIVHVERATGHVADSALVGERAGGVSDGPLTVGSKTEVVVLRLALLARNEFLPEADHQAAPVVRAAAGVVNRLEGVAQDRRHRRIVEFLAEQRGFGGERARWHGGHAAVGEAGVTDDAGLIEVHAERGGDDADVEFAALGDFQEIHAPG